ncbi:hypothetical protein BCR43DRAFT_526262 [Syncephalastrum racemosum]|uniref:Uncharacterized protein n=1 Tax=Syncephalastrum racemosum TaxID=13706 RepID=A0A1X2H5S2_SYNRA|nr:hypothetical protein BCR43DRAFT_526262 [Syncephalastrum racemosum]
MSVASDVGSSASLTPIREPSGGFRKFDQFEEFYFSKHTNEANRFLNRTGTNLWIIISLYAAIRRRWHMLWVGLVQGYVLAWIGQVIFEKSGKPLTLARYPIWSLMCSLRLWRSASRRLK